MVCVLWGWGGMRGLWLVCDVFVSVWLVRLAWFCVLCVFRVVVCGCVCAIAGVTACNGFNGWVWLGVYV